MNATERLAFARENVEEMTAHYVIAMLWSTHDESDESGGEPMDANYSACDLDSDFAAECERDCLRFLYRAAPLCVESNYRGRSSAGIIQQVGHDFWLTRAGHGAGFWDGDWLSDAHCGLDGPLTRLAKSFGDVSPYVGDDGAIYG